MTANSKTEAPLVGVIMGSRSDWDTMSHAVRTLEALGVPYEARVVSAHRTPDLLFDYAEAAVGRGLQVIIAGAGGAAHLPGMCAAKTRLPVLGVPVQSKAFNGLDSLLSIVQMRPASRWARWPSALRGPPMRRCWPPACSPPATRRWPSGSRRTAARRRRKCSTTRH